MNIKNILFEGLKKAAHERTIASLGNRASYVGASDIVAAQDCLRKVVLKKLQPAAEESEQSLLTKERGHWIENGLADSFSAQGIPFLQQLEIGFTAHGVEHRFHLDFVAVIANMLVVIEVKSQRLKKPELYSNYKNQIKCQIEALSRLWHEAAFRVGSTGRYQTMDALLMSNFGIIVNKQIEGHVCVVSAGDYMEPFGPYFPGDSAFWRDALMISKRIYSGMLNQSGLQGLQYARGFYPLCEYCDYYATCPKFRGAQVESTADPVSRLLKIKEEIKNLNTEDKRLSDALKNYFTRVEVYLPAGKKNKYVKSSAGAFTCSVSPKTSYAEERLLKAMESRGISKKIQEEILDEAGVTSTTTRLYVYPPAPKQIQHLISVQKQAHAQATP